MQKQLRKTWKLSINVNIKYDSLDVNIDMWVLAYYEHLPLYQFQQFMQFFLQLN